MQPLGDFFPYLLHFRPAGAFLFRFRQGYDMVFTGDGRVYRFPPCRAPPLIGFYLLCPRMFRCGFSVFRRAVPLVKKQRLLLVPEQLFRRTAKPLKEQQVIPLFQCKVLELQQIVFFRIFSGQFFYDRLSFGLPKLNLPDVFPNFRV